MYKLQSGIALPPRRVAKPKKLRQHKYPFRQMEIGMSFLVPKKEANGDMSRLMVRLSAAAHAAKKLNGFKFALRQMDDGVRVWRIQ